MFDSTLDIITKGLDHMDEGISMYDGGFRLVSWNHAFVELLEFPEDLPRAGLPISEFIRYNAKRGIYGEGAPEDLMKSRLAILEKRERYTEQRIHSDGRSIEINQFPIAGGGLVITYRDISDRKRIEAMARLTEERFRAFMDETPVIAFIKDEKGRHLYINDQIEKHLGVSTDRIIGKTDAEFWEPEGARLHMAQDQEILESGVRRTYEEKVVVDGKEMFFLVSKFPFSLPDGSRYLGGIATDATDLKRAEEAVRRSEKNLENAQRIAQVGSFEWNMKTGELNWSKETYRVYGLDPANFEPSDEEFMEIVHYDDRQKIEDATEAAITGDMTYAVDHRLVWPDGEVRHVRSRGEVERGEDGTAEWLRGTVQDVTDQWRTERQAREYLDIAGNVILAIDRDAIITLFNQAACAVLECDAEDVIGKDYFSLFVPEEEREERRAWYRQRLGDSITGRLEKDVRVVSAKGKDRILRYTVSAIRDNAGQIVGNLSSGVDVTAQRLAESKIEQEKTRALDYLQIAGSIIFAVAADGDVVLMNRAGCRLLECKEAEAVGHDWFDNFVPADERNSRRDIFRQWMSGEQDITSNVESRVISLKGNERVVRWQVAPLMDETGNLAGILSSGHDMTDQLRTEGQLRQAQKMEAVGQLTSGIAHDFNNILAVVMGNLELATDAIPAGSATDRYLSKAMAGAQQGADLNRQLLTFSRQQSFEEKLCDVNSVLTNMVAIVQRTLGEGVEIVTVFSDRDCFSQFDPVELESAVLNLVLNARDAMPEGGTLTIETSIADSDEYLGANEAGEKQVHIMVGDTGTGMDPDVRERAVEPFFTTKDAGSGSGLGLSMVYGFVERCGGWMEIDSREGQGCQVHLFLPAKEVGPAPVAGDTSISVRAPAKGQTVLVVEDQDQVLDIVGNYLHSLGYQVLLATSGVEAFRIIDEADGSIDVVLSDMALPGSIDGAKVLSVAQQKLPGAKLILMSGNLAPPIHDRNNRLGDLPLLRKPFRKADLERVLSPDS